jgi:hypothetical protein
MTAPGSASTFVPLAAGAEKVEAFKKTGNAFHRRELTRITAGHSRHNGRFINRSWGVPGHRFCVGESA